MIVKIVSILLISSVKFIFAFPLAIKYNFNFGTTFLLTSTGGIAGILFFSFFWQHVILLYLWFIHSYLYKFPKIRNFLKKLKSKIVPYREPKNVPFKRKRRYVWFKQNSGLLGIAILTPFILSIPVGTFLAVRFFGRNVRTLMFLSVTLVIWSLVLSIFVHWIGLRY